MKCSLTARRTKAGQRAYTLFEMAVAVGLMGAVSVTIFSVLRSSALLASQNTGINVSASRAREVIDQINDKARYATEQPALLNTDGSLAAGSTADGILIKKLLGSPYVVKDTSGNTTDLASTATQFVIQYLTGGVPSEYPLLIDPAVGDWIALDSVTLPELEISAVSSLTSVTLNGETFSRKLVTTTAAVGEALRISNYRVSGSLFRKEAYTFVVTDSLANPHYQLRHYPRVVGSTVYSTAANYSVMADGYRRLQSQAFFTNSTSNGAATATLRTVVNSSVRQEYVARGNATSTFTALPVQLKLWSLNR